MIIKKIKKLIDHNAIDYIQQLFYYIDTNKNVNQINHVCGIHAIKNLVSQRNNYQHSETQQAINIMMWLSQSNINTLNGIESFTKTFPSYKNFTFKDIKLIANGQYTYQLKAQFAMSPENIKNYLSNIEEIETNIYTVKASSLTELSSQYLYGSIVGLSSSNANTNNHQGLLHWVYVDNDGKHIWNYGIKVPTDTYIKEFDENNINSKYKLFSKIIYVIK